MITAISPDILRFRHRLSPQQINALFGRRVIEESFEEKAIALGKVAEFLRVTDALTAAGIRFIPLKGPLLSYRLYGDATFRYFSDLDILTDTSNLTRIEGILKGEGYIAYGLPWPQVLKKQSQMLRYGHHIAFVHPDKQTAFEIHWKLATDSWLNFRSFDVLSSAFLSKVDFEGRSFTVLNRETELFFLVIHGGHHRWGMLKWLADINMYLNSQEISWERFSDQARSLNAGRMVALCNAMLSEYFPGGPLLNDSSGVPGYMVSASMKTIASQVYTGPDTIREILVSLPFSLLAYPGSRYKVRLLWQTVSSSFYHGRLSHILN